MDKSQGQKYAASLFFGGLAADVDSEMLDAKSGAVLESHCMHVSNVAKNKLRLMRGDAGYSAIVPIVEDITLIGGVWLKGYIVAFYRDPFIPLTYIYANNILIGQHEDFPSSYFDIDTNDETTEMFITDNVTSPVVLNFQDMFDNRTGDKYFTEYDASLYSVNKPLQLNQPVFVQLEDIGPGGGLKYGSYAYSICYSSQSGEDTPWGPITPYIPVPANSASSLSTEGFFSGMKTWGGQPDLTPGRYGIRLRIRVANISGFDYIKIRRYANNTGQPVSYTPKAEYIILSTSATGGVVDIQSSKFGVVEFIDNDSRAWATLDESALQTYSTINKARTIRYYDRRIVLGGVEYDSQIVADKDIFIMEADRNRIAFPVVKQLDERAFSDPINQVYYKSHRLGERYGYGAELRDEQGNVMFTIPLKFGSDDFTNYQFPNRRDIIPQGVKRVDIITLSGTVGSVTILCDGVTRTATFHLSIEQTVSNFVAANSAAYLAGGVVLTGYLNQLIFTSATAGVNFTGTTSATTVTGGNLSGSVADTQPNINPTRQYDEVALGGTVGSIDITCESVTRTFYLGATQTVEDAIEEFYWNHKWVYEAIPGITMNWNVSGVSFEGPTDGTGITTLTSNAIGDVTGVVNTVVTPDVGQSEKDTVTLTGTGGNCIITCKGLSRSVTFDTSLTITATKFVTMHSSFYASHGIQVTSSGVTVIFTAQAGYPFGVSTTVVNTAHDLAGSVTYFRANVAGGGELDASPNALVDSTVASWNADSVDSVYDPVKARRTARTLDTAHVSNIISWTADDLTEPFPYSPVTPTGRGSSQNNNNYKGITHAHNVGSIDGVSVANNQGQYGDIISTIGLRIGGINVAALPSKVKSFSIVRTPAAGRVVCQGIGMYSLNELTSADTAPSLTKALNKIWFYSPELDSVIGDKTGIYEDIKNNPGNYTIQLVAPCGFFSDFYSSHQFDGSVSRQLQDFVSMPICGAGNNARNMFLPDIGGSIGRNNYISFGKWRNTAAQAALNASLSFSISDARDVPHGKIRTPYLELSLGANIYGQTNVNTEAANDPDSKAFHEPWYIVNIIQEGKNVPNENINTYNSIGHSIMLESVVGISNGGASQTFALVDERREDVYSLAATAAGYRYIWVSGKPWVESHNIGSVAAYLSTLETTGYFTPTNGLQCYGIFTLTSDNVITFDKVLPISLEVVRPVEGDEVVVKYNSNSPIEIFLGDTFVAPASFLAVDVAPMALSMVVPEDLETIKNNCFRLEAPMPHYNFTWNSNYRRCRTHTQIITPPPFPEATMWEGANNDHTSYIRQWLIYFTCESTINLPLMYKDFFPSRLYAMRPRERVAKIPTETVPEFFERIGIYPEYDTDYPDEYMTWNYGGFSTPASANYDYQKLLPTKSYSEPKSGINEILNRPKRLHWSTQNLPGEFSNRLFIPTNVYDLKNDKASQISILYDAFSDRGSNLYVITDRGAGMLLAGKDMITTAEGNNLTILASESSLIKGEVWLNPSIGCPGEFWRGKAEGNIKLPNNVISPILVFPDYKDIILMTNNNFVAITDNDRGVIRTQLGLTDLTGAFTTKLYSVIDETDNRILSKIGDKTFSFNFDINNWDGHLFQTKYEKSFYARYLEGSTERNVLAHILNDGVDLGIVISPDSPTVVTNFGAGPYVVFSITPNLGGSFEFIDMFISSTFAPSTVVVSLDRNFIDAATVPSNKIIMYNTGWFHIKRLPRTPSGKVLIGKTLYVKVTFPDRTEFYDIKLVRTGYKEVTGG